MIGCLLWRVFSQGFIGLLCVYTISFFSSKIVSRIERSNLRPRGAILLDDFAYHRSVNGSTDANSKIAHQMAVRDSNLWWIDIRYTKGSFEALA